jgi:hypothetical protein
LQQLTVTLTSAQILNLGTTPVTLIPAPSPNEAIFLHAVTLHMKAGTTPYTVDGDAGLAIYLGTPNSWRPFNINQSGLLDAATDRWCMCDTSFQNLFAPDDPSALPAIFYNVGIPPTDGNGTLVITLDYTLDQT